MAHKNWTCMNRIVRAPLWVVVFFLFVCVCVNRGYAQVVPVASPEEVDIEAEPYLKKVEVSGLRLAQANTTVSVAATIEGYVRDSSSLQPISNVKVFVMQGTDVEVAFTETDSSGYYRLNVPAGTYNVVVSGLSYTAINKPMVLAENGFYSADYVLAPIETSASFFQVLNGNLVEGGPSDITLQNNRVAMGIAVKTIDGQLGKTAKGKPLDFSTAKGVDGFDWINLPIVSPKKLSGVEGSAASMGRNLLFDDVKIVSSSASLSKVVSTGTCVNLPLKVTNTFTVRPNQDWVDVTSVLVNKADTAVTFWVGDAMDNDELGQSSIYPTDKFHSSVIVTTDPGLNEFVPARPWMGCFGSSSQAFGIRYSGDFANGFVIGANTARTVAQKQVTLAPGASYDLERQVIAISTDTFPTKSTALEAYFTSTLEDEWGVTCQLTTDKKRYAVGDTIQCTMSVTNNYQYFAFEEVSAALQLPGFWKSNLDTIYIGDVGPGKTVKVSWKLIPQETCGNINLTGELFAWSSAYSQSIVPLFVEGSGWYAGDNHMHSLYSDGYGTIPQIAASAKATGLSFISVTDHNTMRQYYDLTAIKDSNLVALCGEEVTTRYKLSACWGHALALFCEKLVPYHDDPSLENAQEIVDNIYASTDGKGFPVMAHPYLTGCPWKYTDVTGFKAIEVMSAYVLPNSDAAKKARQLWDTKLQSGLKMYGFANSDAHSLDVIGMFRIVANLGALNKEEVRKAIFAGHYYGTEGPDLRFTIDGANMGESLNIPYKKAVRISLKATSKNGIDSMRLIKNGVVYRTFYYPDAPKSVSTELYDVAFSGDYYRMDTRDALEGFAFSNPIFLTEPSQYVPAVIDTLTGIKDGPSFAFRVGPNPATDQVRVVMDAPSDVSASIVDLDGRVWWSRLIRGEKEWTIDVHSLPRGIHILRLNEKRVKLVLR
jgi:hypothetical protein